MKADRLAALEVITAVGATGVEFFVSGYLRHRCPFAPEIDEGTVEIRLVIDASTVELHSLRRYLATFADEALPHEALTDLVASELAAALNPRSIEVVTRWRTAGFEVVVTARR